MPTTHRILADNECLYGYDKLFCRTDDGHWHLIYLDGAAPQNFQYAESLDNGASWTTEFLGSKAGGGGLVADKHGDLHAVWSDNVLGTNTIYYNKRTSGVWGVKVPLFAGSSQSQPTLCVDSRDNIHVAWSGWNMAHPANTQIRYIKFTDGGAWGSIVELTDYAFNNTNPSIVSDINNNIHVCWYDSVNAWPYYVQYIDGSWGAAGTLYVADTGCRARAITNHSGQVGFMWWANNAPNSAIRMKRWTLAGGLGAVETVHTTANALASGAVSMVDKQNTIYVVWPEQVGTWKIYLTKFESGAWTTPVAVADSGGANTQMFPVMMTAYNNIQYGYGMLYTLNKFILKEFWLYFTDDLRWDSPAQRVMG